MSATPRPEGLGVVLGVTVEIASCRKPRLVDFTRMSIRVPVDENKKDKDRSAVVGYVRVIDERTSYRPHMSSASTPNTALELTRIR